jgi:hypothetical protein
VEVGSGTLRQQVSMAQDLGHPALARAPRESVAMVDGECRLALAALQSRGGIPNKPHRRMVRC